MYTEHGKHNQEPTCCLASLQLACNCSLQPLHLGQKALYNDLLEIHLLPSTSNQGSYPERLSYLQHMLTSYFSCATVWPKSSGACYSMLPQGL